MITSIEEPTAAAIEEVVFKGNEEIKVDAEEKVLAHTSRLYSKLK